MRIAIPNNYGGFEQCAEYLSVGGTNPALLEAMAAKTLILLINLFLVKMPFTFHLLMN
jgi:hypothetical protein